MLRSPLVALVVGVTAGGLIGCGPQPAPGDDADTKRSIRHLDVIHSRPEDVPSPIEVTPAAAAEIEKSIAEMERPDADIFLRVRFELGGCTGVLHKLDLDAEVTPEDRTFVSGGVRVVVAEKQLEHFRGARVDYVNDPGKTGFTVTNPKREAEAAKKGP
jgi:iron-sulfur cluster assembly accessory protein